MSSSLDNLPKLPKPDFSREHRLGLVVYGGVSLAIYMNGICQEFYNAVRGRGIYKLIKALTDADIVVDIISGTSAGGINGVLLSYALANSTEKKYINFKEFADVWKKEGDINKLFFKINKKADRGADKSSFFNGLEYQNKIITALKNCAIEDAPEDDWFSEFGELDLFITGTDIQGKIYQVFDSTDCVIDVKDHQAIFHLKYRDYDSEGNPFNPNDKIIREALAKLCRITSCFPVAFPAVTVKLEFTPPNVPDPDQKLVEWGSLNDRIVPEKTPEEDKQKKNPNTDDDPGRGYRLHFVDGGVLDNRPFSYTIKEIYHRAADRPVFRKLFYIDPSPERFVGNPKYDDMLKPDIVQVVQDSLLSMPGYESINNDLEQINEHNEKVRRYKFLLVDLENLLDLEKKDRENNDYYDQQRNVYLRTRLISLEDKILPLVFLKSERLVTAKANPQEENRIKKLEKVANLLAEPFADPEGSSQRLALLEQLENGICNLDVDYTLRRYFFITEYVYRLLDEKYLCEWLKNKKKQEIDKRITQEKIRNKNEEELAQFSIDAELKKDEIDTRLSKLEKTEIKSILGKLRDLIQKLNEQRKLIEVIKGSLDKLFIGDGIETYFSGLLDNPKQFANKFYKAMLWLHGKFLFVKDDSVLKSKLEKLSVQGLTQELTQELTIFLNEQAHKPEFKEPRSYLDEFFQNSSSDKDLLENLSKSSLLKNLVDETQKELSSNCDEKIDYYSYIKDKLGKYFGEFEKFDTVLYPLDYLAGVPEKQLIETFRISPEDAKLGLSSRFEKGERLDKKLAGDSFRAFGGFLKKSWRANDILWGRLDGFNRIVDALVTKDKIKNFEKFLQREAEREAKRKKEPINAADYLDSLIEEALSLDFYIKRKSNSEEDKQYLRKKKDELKQKIRNLIPSLDVRSADGQDLKFENKSEETALEELAKTLVSIGHLLILDQEFEETMQTSIEEQLDWKLQQQPPKESEANENETKDSNQESKKTIQIVAEKQSDGKQKSQSAKDSEDLPPIPKFDPINLSFDSAITALAVKQLAQNSLVSMSLKEKEEFFNKDYKIGLETWEHIPLPEFIEIILRAICIFQDIFATWQLTRENRRENKTSSHPTFWNKLAFLLVSGLTNCTIFLLNCTIFVLKIMRSLVK